MMAIQRKLTIEAFCENTSIHGVAYLNTRNRASKVTWGLIVCASTLLIVLGTVLLVQRYLNYSDYIITKEYDLDKLEEIPNVLVCLSDQLSMADSVLRLNLSLNTPVSTLSSVVGSNNTTRRLIELVNCEINIRSRVLDCMKFKWEIIFTFSGFCLLIDLQELKQNESLFFKQFDRFAYFATYTPKIEMNFKAEQKLLYFKLLSSIASPRNLLENHLIIDPNSYKLVPAKRYDVISQQDSFSSSLGNKKCFSKIKQHLESQAGYDEYSCEFECLQRLIMKVLKCNFSFNGKMTLSDSPYCSVKQIRDIEEIVKNYTILKSFE
jgi:Amiloride-sensitive sodium channel